MISLSLLCFSCAFCVTQGIVYDSYDGIAISEEEVIQHTKHNTTFWCINDIEPCDPGEWRRLDGSCNNLRHPTRGATRTPLYRMLSAAYDKDFEPRKSKSGDLPLVRRLRTSFLSEAKVPDQQFTILATYFLVFISSDITNLHDSVNYIQWTPYCCTPKGKDDHMCAPIEVPADDPVHRFTGIRCLNLTKPMTFQTVGCRSKDTPPERILSATPLFDLSTVYGNTLDKALEGRKYQGGLLKYEVEDGRLWPPQDKNHPDCFLNRKPHETRCHKTPSGEVNTLMSINIVSVWFWRLHNHIADRLAKINPCWDDERLFYTARDITIAIEMQIFLYELLPMMMGYDNLVNDGVLYPVGFRDVYNNTFLPQLSMEFPLALRWLHKMVEGTLKMYDADGNYVKEVEQVNLTIRTGYLAVDNNIDYLTQGSFRQASAKIDDNIVDPDMAEKVLGVVQPSQDVFSNDLAKNRLMFMQPYVKYLEHFSERKITCFDDLVEFFEPEILEKLSELYDSVEDIDLLAGMWVEKSIEGGRVPHMFYSITVEQLIRTMQSDRHWYERPNRPHAFTWDQLQEIRKASIARLLCDVGDSVTHIQPKAFQRIGPGNLMQNCEEIPDIDIIAWKDDSCWHSNLVQSGVISENPGFRNIHDPTKCPSITLESIYANRWFQDATAKLYDEHGHYLRDFPMFNLTTRTGFLVKHKRMEEFTQGQFRQPCGNVNDRTIDYEVADNGLPLLQCAADITTSDLQKNRLLGLRPYIDYIHYCSGHKITCFDDLCRHIDPCTIKELMKVYEHVRDVHLMAGMWCEKRLDGGWIPRTLACLLNDNLLKAIKGDSHWYENEHRPYAFTKRQLLEIRKASLAWLLCTVGDGVTKVQRHAFLTISPKNPLQKCCQIPGINLEAWADPACSSGSCK